MVIMAELPSALGEILEAAHVCRAVVRVTCRLKSRDNILKILFKAFPRHDAV
jgi:hypothetical protein